MGDRKSWNTGTWNRNNTQEIRNKKSEALDQCVTSTRALAAAQLSQTQQSAKSGSLSWLNPSNISASDCSLDLNLVHDHSLDLTESHT